MAIIRSLLDLDLYKLTMMQLVWLLHAGTPVRYRFINRTKGVKLGEAISRKELLRETNAIRELRFTADELAYLGTLGIFKDEFLTALEAFKGLPPVKVVAKKDDQLEIEAVGSWYEVILWETMLLSVVNELYYRKMLATRGMDAKEARVEGYRRLEDKIRRLILEAPSAKIIEFGTRRRFSFEWQDEVVRMLEERLPSGMFIGTSNVLLAKKHGLRPIGTFAHELYMVYACKYGETDEGLRFSHNLVMHDWFEMYGESLSIALTDTFGSDFFFRDMTPAQAVQWRGLRQDSGDPLEFGERAVAFYEELGIDPRSKKVVFSDGLDVDAVVKLEKRFHGRIGTSYGWGTNLTNDLGLEPLSMVVKVVEAAGRPAVKLSDTVGKHLGPAEEVERYKRVFGYSGGLDLECRY